MSRTFAVISLVVLLLGTICIAGLWWLTDKQHRVQQEDRRAGALLERGELAKAMAVWQKLLDENPGHITLLNRLGIACTKGEDFAKAESYFRRAMQLEPREPQAYFNLALLRMRQKRMDQAERMLLELIKIADWYPEANYHLGYIYEKRGQLDLAMHYYVLELHFNSASAKAWRRLLALKEQTSSGVDKQPSKASPGR